MCTAKRPVGGARTKTGRFSVPRAREVHELLKDDGIGEEARAGEKGGLGGQCERLRAALMVLSGWLVGLAVVPHWVRGQEWCTMLSPRRDYRVSMLGLGTSVGTGPQGITAQVGR